ncbi:MAG TPA: hypothetical protein VM345_16880 [Acidimicrobiales bacterium]|jgi:hypothetical protein|nr:hypothetical protein [Acidimicrobiales bacterium]
MKFRLGVLIGFGAGYYLGAMAGRERYEQMNKMIKKVKRSDAFEEAADKAKAAVDLGVERAKDIVDSKTSSTPSTNGGGIKVDRDDLQGSPTPY